MPCQKNHSFKIKENYTGPLTREIIEKIRRDDYRRVKIRNEFNNSIDKLPDNVEYLYIRGKFNKKVNKWPSNLKVLNFSKCNLSRLICKLPDCLERLDIPESCVITDINVIPENIKWLSFSIGDYSDKDGLINIELWKNLYKFKKLTHLRIYGFGHSGFDVETNFPPNLTHLRLKINYGCDLSNLPKKLSHLYLEKYSKSIDVLPKNLRSLTIKGYKFDINFLNSKLTYLKIGFYYKNKSNINYELPDSLVELDIDNYKNKINFPKNLKKLSIENYMFDLDNLPNSLTKLYFYDFNMKIKLPEKLKKIRGIYYNQELGELPDSLEEFDINSYNFPINKLPSKLKIINTLNNDYLIRGISIPKSLKSISLNESTWESYILTLKCVYRKTKEIEYELYSEEEWEDIDDEEEIDPKDVIEYKEPIDPSTLIMPPNYYDKIKLMLKSIPSQVTELNIDIEPNTFELEDLPRHFKKMYINTKKFNKPFNNLPQSLTDLSIYGVGSDKSNDSIGLFDNLPSGIKILKLGVDNINCSLDNLPDSIEHLNIETYKYNRPLDNLPNNINYFKICFESNTFKYPYKMNNLPNSIKTIESNVYNFESIMENKPNNLRALTCYNIIHKRKKNKDEEDSEDSEDDED